MFLSPLGGGGGSRPSLIFSCFSFSTSRLLCVRIFFLSFFVNMMGAIGASLGSAEQSNNIYYLSIDHVSNMMNVFN